MNSTYNFLSHDKNYMNNIKEAILSSPSLEEDRKYYIYKSIKNRIITDDLQNHIHFQYASFNIDSPIYMGHGVYNPSLLFITNLPSELNTNIFTMINSISNALNIGDAYTTSLCKFNYHDERFINTMKEFLYYQIQYLKPSYVISFGVHLDSSLISKNTSLICTYSLDDLPSNEDELKALKNKIWKDIKHIRLT